ncbi:MAG: YhbY family RNA-binding protein [bacterium]|nr:YhbY family RNA-binding protein [bacterium]
MIELTGKQKKRLRGLGQRLDATVTVGKEGVTDPVAKGISDLLDKRELVKVRLTGPSGDARKEVGPVLAQATQSACISIVGKTVVLYRPNSDLKASKRIDLDS